MHDRRKKHRVFHVNMLHTSTEMASLVSESGAQEMDSDTEPMEWKQQEDEPKICEGLMVEHKEDLQ